MLAKSTDAIFCKSSNSYEYVSRFGFRSSTTSTDSGSVIVSWNRCGMFEYFVFSVTFGLFTTMTDFSYRKPILLRLTKFQLIRRKYEGIFRWKFLCFGAILVEKMRNSYERYPYSWSVWLEIWFGIKFCAKNELDQFSR